MDVDSGRRGFWWTWILVDVEVHPSSVLPRRSCCNWASPVTRINGLILEEGSYIISYIVALALREGKD